MTNTVHREFLELGSCSSATTLASRLVAIGQLLEFEIATAAVAVDRPGQRPDFRALRRQPG